MYHSTIDYGGLQEVLRGSTLLEPSLNPRTPLGLGICSHSFQAAASQEGFLQPLLEFVDEVRFLRSRQTAPLKTHLGSLVVAGVEELDRRPQRLGEILAIEY